MMPDWKEPENLADKITADAESTDEPHRRSPISGSLQGSRLPPGSTFAGHYEILCVLGQGGMSTVYKAKHVLVDSVRAIKIIRSDQADNRKVLQRFQQEGKSALALEHPNIARVYEFGIELTLNTPYLVMDYVEGKTLAGTLSAEGMLTAERACRLVRAVCDGLQKAHSKDVVHRDITPGNIILTKDQAGVETVKIVDFGIAKIIGPDECQNLTQTGEVIGTPLYMSPEQCLGQNLDARSDIYSLGCVLYECLTGKPPLQGSSAIATIMMHSRGAKIDFAGISPQLQSILLRCLDTKPERRYQSVEDLAQALERVPNDRRPFIAQCHNAWALLSRGNLRDKVVVFTTVGMIATFLVMACALVYAHMLNQSMKVHLIAEGRTDHVKWCGIAHELEQKGDLIDAERAFRKAIELKPDYKHAWVGLGEILKKRGNSTGAEAAFRRAGELTSDSER